MKKLYLILFSIFSVVPSQAQSISKALDGRSWTLKTNSSIYHLAISKDNVVEMKYFGSKSQDINRLEECFGNEVTVRGGYINTASQLEILFPDGVRDIELDYMSDEIMTINNCQILKIIQRDKYYPLEIISYIAVMPKYDLIEKWIEIRNLGKKDNIKIEKAFSGSVFLPKDDYKLTHYAGIWGTEFTPQTTLLTPGTKTIQVKDFKSYGSSSFIIRPEGETDQYAGKTWFGSIKYSGNWRIDFEKAFTGSVQILGGMNFWDQELYLNPGKSFTTPRMLFGYTEHGTEGVTQNLTSYIRDQLLPSTHRNRIRPVLYNSWYATTFDVNEEHQLALAKVAKELGVEMFVIDDGWFKGRVNDKAGLGDWAVDKNKFPNGLKPMIDKINAMGLDFGIWIEPEMVNPNSDLYRKHPDWVFHFPNRKRHEGRNQLILNLAREDVYQYLYNSFHQLLKENNIKFIKWDMNKHMTDPGFPSAPTDEQRSVRIKYMENLYRLVETLRNEYPEVWFENCSSGGGRVDMSMSERFDFNWVSDNTDPVERIFIQDSYLTLFPANTMISWVTHEDWHQQNHSLDYKFDVCMAGVLGVGYDITKWTEKEKNTAKEKIVRYKDIRNTVQFGVQHRLVSPYNNNCSVIQYVNKSQDESIVFFYNLAEYSNNGISENKRSNVVRLKGLEENSQYRIEGMEGIFGGDYLINTGIYFPVRGAFKSQIYKIEKVK